MHALCAIMLGQHETMAHTSRVIYPRIKLCQPTKRQGQGRVRAWTRDAVWLFRIRIWIDASCTLATRHDDAYWVTTALSRSGSITSSFDGLLFKSRLSSFVSARQADEARETSSPTYFIFSSLHALVRFKENRLQRWQVAMRWDNYT